MDEAPTIENSTEIIVPGQREVAPQFVQQRGLFMPKTMGELVSLAKYAAHSGAFGTLTEPQAAMVMIHGDELGITPLQALRELYVIKGKIVPSAGLIAGLIQRMRNVEWKVNEGGTGKEMFCEISGKRDGKPFSRRLTIDDIPSHLLTSSDNWKKFPADMLYARCVRQVSKRHFQDVVSGLPGIDDFDDTKVIDVRVVERALGEPEYPPCPDCGGVQVLRAANNGGAFLACLQCTHTQPPPQEVRDAVRGHKLEPGEREPEAGELEQIQEASDDGTVAELALEPSVEAAEPSAVPDPPEQHGDPADLRSPEPAVMGRKEFDEHVQSILTSLTAAKRTGHLEAARTVLRAHGWDDTPLTSWLMRHSEELPGLVEALTMEAPA